MENEMTSTTGRSPQVSVVSAQLYIDIAAFVTSNGNGNTVTKKVAQDSLPSHRNSHR